MERTELEAWLRLSLTAGVGNGAARKLLAAFGGPEAVFGQTEAALCQVVNPAQAAAIVQVPEGLSALLETTGAWLGAHNAVCHQIAVLGAANYPPALLTMEDPPLMLYLMGGPPTQASQPYPGRQEEPPAMSDWLAHGLRNCIAIVGSRNPTHQGAANARNFGHALASAGLTVVSGLAHGVDGAAHEGALDSLVDGAPRMTTIAVVGTGLDRVYPKEHRTLAHRIARNGLIVSEYPLGTPPLAANFPRRNRIIAGLAHGTLVVEAALKSGSLITARLAAEQGKEVFAIPGSIHATQSRGCHALIKQGAKLVESAQDVIEELQLNLGTPPIDQTDRDEPAPAIGADQLLTDALGFDPVGLDALQARCGLETATLQARLMTLELDGHVARLPGGLFQRVV